MLLAELPFPRIDPVAIDLPGPIDVRWYSLMYIAGFATAYLIIRHLSRQNWIAGLQPAHVDELVTVLGLAAVVGGRVGYLLIYDLPNVVANPREALKIWEGGMSFHGGLAGVAIAALWVARRRDVRLAPLADALALSAPPGLFAVRLTNFINGWSRRRFIAPLGSAVPHRPTRARAARRARRAASTRRGRPAGVRHGPMGRH